MNKTDEKPVLLSKRNKIQTLLDYCLDAKIGFTVNPRIIGNDEFEVEVDINNFKQAIALGMFAKENKFEVTGLGDLVKTKTSAKKSEVKESVSNLQDLVQPAEAKEKEESSATLDFGLGVNNN